MTMSEDPKSSLQEGLELLLVELEFKVPLWGVTLFTVDGYVLAHKLFYRKMPDEIEMIVSSMSASLISIAEDFIKFVDSKSVFRQTIIDADNEKASLKFSILLKRLANNVLLTCIFPVSSQLGLIFYEIDILGEQVNRYLSQWDAKVHFETAT
ncbi:MAG: roadblock/LC7 domain-containing protein [Candidatus Hodarchaeota archaeon]